MLVIESKLTDELICDFLHVSLRMVEIILCIKERDKIFLISVSNLLSGKQAETYTVGDNGLIMTIKYQVINNIGDINGGRFPLLNLLKTIFLDEQ